MSEVLWYVAMPSSVLLALAVLALVAAWAGRPLLAGALLAVPVAALAVLSVVPLDEVLAAPLEGRLAPPDPMPTQVDGVVVLGGAVDDRVSRARGQLALDGAGERVLAALALARRYPGVPLVFTGVYADVLTLGWPGSAGPDGFVASALAGHSVRTLGAARSTYEEASLARDAVEPASGERWLLVTSALHMPRAHATFATLGWDTVPYPVDYRSPGGTAAPRIGRPGARLAALDTVVREWGALWIYRRSGRIGGPGGSAADGGRRAQAAGAGPGAPPPAAHRTQPAATDRAPRAMRSSAICTAFNAAPLRI